MGVGFSQKIALVQHHFKHDGELYRAFFPRGLVKYTFKWFWTLFESTREMQPFVRSLIESNFSKKYIKYLSEIEEFSKKILLINTMVSYRSYIYVS